MATGPVSRTDPTAILGNHEDRIKALELYRSVEEIKYSGRQFDLIFLTVNSYDTEESVRDLLPLMGEETTLVSFQNGLGNIETILKKINPERFLAARVIFGAEISPGKAPDSD